MDSVQNPPSKENSPFHKVSFQACSTPCTNPVKRHLSWSANVSSVLEETTECSSAEGFSKSGQDTIFIPENDNSGTPETTVLTQQVNSLYCNRSNELTPANKELADQICANKSEMNNNEINKGNGLDKPVALLLSAPLIGHPKKSHLGISKLENSKLTDGEGASHTDVNSKEISTDSSAMCRDQMIFSDDINLELAKECRSKRFLSTAKADVKINSTSAFNKTIMDSSKQLNQSGNNSPIKIKIRVQPIVLSIDPCDLNSSSNKIKVNPVSVLVESDKLNESANCIQVDSFCLSIDSDDIEFPSTLTDKNTLIKKERMESVKQEFDQNSSKLRLNISIVTSIENIKDSTENSMPDTLKLEKDTNIEEKKVKILTKRPGPVTTPKSRKKAKHQKLTPSFWKDKDVELNSIAKDEVNVTVTEEDILFSKKDELSMCFDNMKAESFVTIDKSEVTSKLIGLKRPYADIKQSNSDELSKKTSRDIVAPSMKKPRITKEPEIEDRPLEVYVSSNPKENIDNNDPKWFKYKKMTTDELRYEGVKEIWKNPQIPNVNCNLSTYNWRCRNGLSPAHLIKNNNDTYQSVMNGDMRDVFHKARENAKFLFDQKVKTLEAERERQLSEYDHRLHYDLMNNDKIWWQYFYDQHHEGADSVWNVFRNQFRALQNGLEERLRLINKAELEVLTVSDFYKGLGDSTDPSRTRLTPRELCCWYEREDTLSKYEIFYS